MYNRAKSIEVTAVIAQSSGQRLIFIDSSPYKPFVKTNITVFPDWISLIPDPEAERIRKLRKMTLAQIVELQEKRKNGTLTKEEKQLMTSQRNPSEDSQADVMEKSPSEPMPTRADFDRLLHQEEIIPLKRLEKIAICQALMNCNGNKTQAAKKLGISEKTIYNKIKQYKIRFPFVETQNDIPDDPNNPDSSGYTNC